MKDKMEYSPDSVAVKSVAACPCLDLDFDEGESGFEKAMALRDELRTLGVGEVRGEPKLVPIERLADHVLTCWLDWCVQELACDADFAICTAFPILDGNQYLFGREIDFSQASELVVAAAEAKDSGKGRALIQAGTYHTYKHTARGSELMVEHWQIKRRGSYLFRLEQYIDALQQGISLLRSTHHSIQSFIAANAVTYESLSGQINTAFG